MEPVGNVVMKKAVFTVETISAGMGEVLVYVEDPAGHREEVHVSPSRSLNAPFPVRHRDHNLTLKSEGSVSLVP